MKMLGLSGQLYVHRGPLVGDVMRSKRMTRRIGRARERAAWRREVTW